MSRYPCLRRAAIAGFLAILAVPSAAPAADDPLTTCREAVRAARNLEMDRASALIQEGLSFAADDPDEQQAEGWCHYAEGLVASFSVPADDSLAAERFRQSETCFREVGDGEGQGLAMIRLLQISPDIDMISPEAGRIVDEAAALVEEAGSPAGRGQVAFWRGIAAHRGDDPHAAEEWFRRAVGEFSMAGYPRGVAGALCLTGDVAQGRGQLQVARERYEQAVEIYRRTGDVVRLAEAYSTVADIAREQGDRPAFQDYQRLATEATESIPGGYERVTGLLDLSHMHERDGDYRAARAAAERALDNIDRDDPDQDDVEAWAVFQLADLAQDLGDRPTATRLFLEYLDLPWTEGKPVLRGLALKDLGMMALEDGDAARARRHLEGALTLFVELEDDFWVAWIADEIADLDFERGDYTAASSQYHLMAESAQRAGKLGMVGDAWNGVARCEKRLGDLDATVAAIERAVDAYRQDGEIGLVAAKQSWLGDVYFGRGEWALARDAYQACLAAAIEADDEPLRVTALQDLAAVAWKLEDDDGIVRLCRQLIELSERTGDRSPAVYAHRQLGFLSNRQGNQQAALDSWLEAADLARRSSEPDDVFFVLGDIAELRFVRGEFDQAARAAADAAEGFEAMGDVGSEVANRFILGLALGELGSDRDRDRAFHAAEEALQGATEPLPDVRIFALEHALSRGVGVDGAGASVERLASILLELHDKGQCSEVGAATAWSLQAGLALERGDAVQAEALIAQIVKVHEQLGLHDQASGALWWLAEAQALQGKAVAARNSYRRATEHDAAAGAPIDQADSLSNLAEAALEVGDLVTAEEAFMRALALFQRSGQDADALTVLWRLGRIRSEQDDCDGARAWFEQGLGAALALRDPEKEARSLLLLASNCLEDVALDDIYAWTVGARTRAIAIGDRDLEALSWYCEADAAEDAEDWERARAGFEQALDMVRGQSDPASELDIVAALGRVVANQDDMETLEELLQEGRRLAAEVEGGSEDLGAMLGNLALLEREKGHLERAGELFAEALGLFDELGWTTEQALTRVHLSQVAEESGDDAAAAQWCESLCALEIPTVDPEQEADDLAIKGHALALMWDESSSAAIRSHASTGAREVADRLAKLGGESFLAERYWISLQAYMFLEDLAARAGLAEHRAVAAIGAMRASFSLGALEDAHEYARDAQDHLRTARDNDLLGELLIEISVMDQQIGALDTVEEAIREAQQLMSKEGFAEVRPWVALLRAAVALQRGQPELAERRLGEYERLAGAGQTTTHDASACRMRGQVLRSRGDLRAASRQFEGCVAEAADAGLAMSEARATLALARCSGERGELREALYFAGHASEMFDRADYWGGHKLAEFVRADLLVEQGDTTQAREVYQYVFTLTDMGIYSTGGLGEMFDGYSRCMLATGMSSHEIKTRFGDVDISSDADTPSLDAVVAEARALVDLHAGDLDGARTHLETADAVWRKLDEPEGRGRVLTRLAEVELLAGKTGPANRYSDRALEELGEDGSLSLVMDASFVRGQVLEIRGRDGQALEAFERAASLGRVLSVDTDVGGRGWVAFAERLTQVHDAALRLRARRAMASVDPAATADAVAAFQLAEERSARFLSRKSRAIGVAMLSESIPESLLQEEEAFAELEQLEVRAACVGLSREDESRREELAAQRSKFAADLRQQPRYMAYAALRFPEIPTPETVSPGPEEVMVRFAVTEDEVYRWVVYRRELVEFGRVGLTRGELEEDIRILRGALTSPYSDALPRGQRGAKVLAGSAEEGPSAREVARKLGDGLLGEALEVLPTHGSLIVVPDGPLFSLPFEALLVEGDDGADVYLGLEVPFTYAPSARFFDMVRQREHHARSFDRELLAVGDPDFSARASSDARALLGITPGDEPGLERDEPTDPHAPTTALALRSGLLTPIPHTGVEIDAVVARFGEDRSRVLTGHEATRAATLEALAGESHRVVHVATHGVLPSEPICDDDGEACLEQPALVFAGTPGATFVDQVLTASDIAALEIPSELVALSACDTAEGDLIRGEGVMGMGQAFLYAGAGTVLMSLWPVDDPATASWMDGFYEGYRDGGDPAQRALEARKSLAAGGPDGTHPEWAHPYYWAPFVVVGATP